MPGNFLHLTETLLEEFGQQLTVHRGNETSNTVGAVYHDRHLILFHPSADIREGDDIVVVASGQHLYVVEMRAEEHRGVITARHAIFETDQQRRRAEEARPLSVQIGDVQGSNINIGAQLTNVTQSISSNPTLSQDTREQLSALITHLKTLLQNDAISQEPDTERVSNSVDSLAEQASKPRPDIEQAQFNLERLQKAASNLGKLVPTILPIALEIAKHFEKILHLAK